MSFNFRRPICFLCCVQPTWSRGVLSCRWEVNFALFSGPMIYMSVWFPIFFMYLSIVPRNALARFRVVECVVD